MPRTNIVRRAAFLAGLAALSAPAAAQYGASAPQSPPPEIPRGNARADAGPATPTAPAEVLRAVACTIGRSANPGTAMLATAPLSSEEVGQAARILRAAQRCARLPAAISTSPLATRGAVAESLYESQFATPVAARTPALAAAPLPRPAAGDPALLAVLTPMYALVDCSTPRQPDLVRALLATEPRAPEEGAAIQALNPAFAGCVPARTQVRIDPRILRAMFAESLYRWSVVQRDGAASPWAAPAAVPAASQ